MYMAHLTLRCYPQKIFLSWEQDECVCVEGGAKVCIFLSSFGAGGPEPDGVIAQSSPSPPPDRLELKVSSRKSAISCHRQGKLG